MKLSNINFDKGANFAPLSNLKCLDAASLDLIGEIIGYGFDSANNVYTNDTNESIARHTNEANKQINAEQLAWAREQYEMEKAENRYLVDQAYQRDIEQRENERKYNSPAMQKQRLLAAGINPTLAMYGSGGSASAGASSAVRSQVGQNAHANQPNAIPMQTGAPMVPFSGLGQGISDSIKNYYMSKENERQDYALAADITFRDRKANQESLNYLLDLRKQGADERWIDAQIQSLFRANALEENKFLYQQKIDEIRNNLDYYNAETQRINAKTSQMLANSKINVDNATIAQISANIAATQVEVEEMIANGVSKRNIEQYVSMREKETYEIIKSDHQFRKDFYGESGNRDLFQRANYGLKAFGETMFAPFRNLLGAAPK